MKSQIFNIVFEDSDILVIEKTSPFLSQRADQGEREGLFEFLSRVKGYSVFPVHRLDRDVLGLMIFGKTKHAADKLSQAFRDRSILKGYEAVIHGRPFKNQGEWIHFLKKNEKNNHVTVFIRPTEGAKEAKLSYWILESQGPLTRVFIRLHTGRSHQIRAQFAKMGHPIKGDFRYGKKKIGKKITNEGSIELKSVFLKLKHPTTNAVMEFSLLSERDRDIVRSKKVFDES